VTNDSPSCPWTQWYGFSIPYPFGISKESLETCCNQPSVHVSGDTCNHLVPGLVYYINLPKLGETVLLCNHDMMSRDSIQHR
jgi:hypothetical protein